VNATTDGVGDDDRFAAFHHCDDRVGGAQVDADDFAHVIPRELPHALRAGSYR
jgi:hypothetical protein